MRLLHLPKIFWIVLILVLAIVSFSFVISGHRIGVGVKNL